MLACGGCSVTDDPTNLEPELIIHEAADITRNEATLSAEIVTHGSGRLSYIKFAYSNSSGKEFYTENLSPDSELTTFRICNLKPGETYTYQAIGGNASATITSDKRQFTTIPNELPKISGATPLSSGPIGIVVGFEITDDGGEEIIEAGCEISESTTGESVRHFVKDGKIYPGKYKIHIGGLSAAKEYMITPFVSNSIGETKGESIKFITTNSVVLEEPGQLQLVFGEEDVDIENLVITGRMNGDDFRYLRRLIGAPPLIGENKLKSSVTSIDLSYIDITEGGLSYDGSRYTSADIISSGLFADCSQLKQLILPISAKAIMRDALKGCTALLSLTIPPGISTLLPSSDCISLESIEVSPANDHFASYDGVLFNQDLTEILWFPIGKKGKYTLPSTMTAIGENAFKDTHINALKIPSSVTTIARGAFSGSELEDIELPEIMKNVSEGMFQNCSNLRIARLGKATEFIGNYIFYGCPLEHLYIAAELPPYVSTNAFTNLDKDLLGKCVLHVPMNSKSRYRNHSQWSKFGKITEE